MTARVLTALSTLAIAIGLTACATDPQAETAIPDTIEAVAEDPAPELPVTLTDATGAEITIESADRIIPLSGSIAEIVFTLGLGDRVVARDITATFDEAEDLPVISRGHDVSAESVLSLNPSLILAETSSGPATALDQIKAAGVPIVTFQAAQSIDDVTNRIDTIATALGLVELGEQLAERTDERLAARQAEIPEGDTPRVAFLYLRGSASVYLIGGTESGAGSLIEAAGAIDAGKEAGLEGDFLPLTPEALAQAQPDVILVMTNGLESVGGIEGLLEIPGIAQTPAGADARIASIEDGILLSYGPRTDQVLSSLIEQIHGGTES